MKRTSASAIREKLISTSKFFKGKAKLRARNSKTTLSCFFFLKIAAAALDDEWRWTLESEFYYPDKPEFLENSEGSGLKNERVGAG